MAKSANMAVSIRSRAATLTVVVMLHALLILALLSAVAPTMLLPDERVLRVFDIVEPPPPPEIAPTAPPSVPEPAGGGGNRGPTPLPEPGNRAIVIAPPRPVEVVPLPAFPILAPPATGASGPSSSGDGAGAGGGDGTGRGTGTGAGAGTGGGVRLARAEWVRKPDPWANYEFWPRSPIGRALEGRCVLACRVKPSGRPYDCIVVDETPIDQGIGKAGVRLVKVGRVKPVTRNGEAVDVRVVIPITFALHKKPKEGATDPTAPAVIAGGL